MWILLCSWRIAPRTMLTSSTLYLLTSDNKRQLLQFIDNDCVLISQQKLSSVCMSASNSVKSSGFRKVRRVSLLYMTFAVDSMAKTSNSGPNLLQILASIPVRIVRCQVNMKGLLPFCDICNCYQFCQKLFKVPQRPLSGRICW